MFRSIPRLRCALDATLAGSLVLATSLTASSAAESAGALRALAATRGILECAHESHTTPLRYARGLSSKHVMLADGTSIVAFEGGCEDGNDNDAIYIVAALESKAYKLVSQEYGFVEKLTPDGTLVVMTNPGGVSVRSHDTERWNGSTFRPASSVMVWVETGESKPTPLPLAFAVGTSSAIVTGTVRRLFPDVYQFDARAGQTMSVDVRPRGGSIGRLVIAVEDGANICSGTALSWHGTLPKAMHAVPLPNYRTRDEAGGHYEISIDGASDARSTYTMTVSIR